MPPTTPDEVTALAPLSFSRRRAIYEDARAAWKANNDGDVRDIARYRMRVEQLKAAITTALKERDEARDVLIAIRGELHT